MIIDFASKVSIFNGENTLYQSEFFSVCNFPHYQTNHKKSTEKCFMSNIFFIQLRLELYFCKHLTIIIFNIINYITN
jgi:hypothetical protein